MKNFYISISNGLLKDGHRKRMGTAVWEFMWLLDKVTMIDSKGNGKVLGGKPINLSEISKQMEMSDDAVSLNLHKLKDEGYISILRTPYGIVILVLKAKKRFVKSSNHIEETRVLPEETRDVIKIDTDDISVDTTAAAEVEKKINQVIKEYEAVNPNYQSLYKRKNQRDASRKLIEINGYEKVIKVIKLLPKTNGRAYYPTITTPLELLEKWSKLESALLKEKDKGLKKQNYIL